MKERKNDDATLSDLFHSACLTLEDFKNSSNHRYPGQWCTQPNQ